MSIDLAFEPVRGRGAIYSYTIMYHAGDRRFASAIPYASIIVELDDAPGEAYDKVAKLLGLGYPGGPVIDRLAREWTPVPGEEEWPLPRPLHGKQALEFSFSGLKTAVVRLVEKRGGHEAVASDPQRIRGLCAAFQERVIGLLMGRALQAVEEQGVRRLALVGGVACNRGLRQAIREQTAGKDIVVAIPPPLFCTDNAAMIAAVGRHLLEAGALSDLDLNADPSLPLGSRDGEKRPWKSGRAR